ncbi:Eco57I restriction-modification methylase [Candidatus Brocadiaceae bacterium B188]|nr:Eco57I restriction-modification methylase domain-containing protein [Candidatus Brocadia sapporoensis]QQR65513.1 MAG: Eco57I restriction-modification methylase domain-containing protein [Candidatus Brocadia sp.]RZV57232.1 MAG: SAM-dependent methyltransferase [Candidatus Brocadia sp. BROELEC01]TWU50408.1 Eco57I restriction-modification methylase [Candidatus Brocadiaceae bacterium B188]
MITQSMHKLDNIRKSFNGSTSRSDRSEIGQFLTPVAIAKFMSSMFESGAQRVKILDPGAGAGVLFATCVETLISRAERPQSIEVVAYETDCAILPYLEDTMRSCQSLCVSKSIEFHGAIKAEDFISAAINEKDTSLFLSPGRRFTHAILNPPYKKINGQTAMSRKLYLSGIEVANLYAIFVWLSMSLLEQGGQMVAITPRSFCNGPYFNKFRFALLRRMSLKRIHVFESRKKAFGDDYVLQENIIYNAARGLQKPDSVLISVSEGLDFDRASTLVVPYGQVVLQGDRDMFIHLDIKKAGVTPLEQIKSFTSSLDKLGLNVSTGRVVDFRAREYLKQSAEHGDVPLIYPCHFANGFIEWPAESDKKPNAIASNEDTSTLLVEAGFYVLTKRFSSKEQQRRIMAAVYDPTRIDAAYVGLENHLNYYHQNGRGLPADLAKGLALYLNSTMVDRYFRIFSGHTQVNATDLRKMPYPSREQLTRLGASIGETMPDQEAIDSIIEKECSNFGK